MSKYNDKIYKYKVNLKSKIHRDIYHTVCIDLRCYEKIPSENKINSQKRLSNKNIKNYVEKQS